jgi:hypothetical protein
VEHQVTTVFDPSSLNLSIGLLSTFGRSAWGWYLDRLGTVVWALRIERGHNWDNLARALQDKVPDFVFVDEGLRLRPNNPVWRCLGIKVVVSTEVWRGKPYGEGWICSTQSFSHQELGGVTNGVFQVHLARNSGVRNEITQVVRRATPAQFKHCLDTTVPGIRCPVPSEKVAPLGQDVRGLLHWERRSGNIEAPTVFSKLHWVRR